MRRFYGMSLAEARERGIGLLEVADMVAHLPREGAVHRAANPHWQASPEIELLRELEFGVRVLAWQNSRDGQRGLNVPERIRLPWDPAPEGSLRGDSMSWDEAADWLGWQHEMDRFFDEGR